MANAFEADVHQHIEDIKAANMYVASRSGSIEQLYNPAGGSFPAGARRRRRPPVAVQYDLGFWFSLVQLVCSLPPTGSFKKTLW